MTRRSQALAARHFVHRARAHLVKSIAATFKARPLLRKQLSSSSHYMPPADSGSSAARQAQVTNITFYCELGHRPDARQREKSVRARCNPRRKEAPALAGASFALIHAARRRRQQTGPGTVLPRRSLRPMPVYVAAVWAFT